MHPVTTLLWRSLWLLSAAAVVVGYGRGWSRLRRVARAAGAPLPRRRLWAPLAAIGLYTLVFMLPLSGPRLFVTRVWEHLILTAVAPPLLMLANPWPILAAGLPADWRARLRHARPEPAFIHWLTSPGVAWALFVVTFWLWYDGGLLAAANRYAVVRWLEWLTLAAAAGLYWLHIAQAQPRRHAPMPPVVRVVYAFGGVLPVKIVGLVLLFGLDQQVGVSAESLAAPLFHLGNLPLTDQAAGALLVWIIGGTAFAYAAAYLAGRVLQAEDDKPPLSLTLFDGTERWSAPGRGQ